MTGAGGKSRCDSEWIKPSALGGSGNFDAVALEAVD
jgi:hypothetical protein